MKKLIPRFSKNYSIAASVCLAATVLIPLKIVVVASAAYYIARKAGAFKLKFPDVWVVDIEAGDVTKNHRVFLTKPVRIEGKMYVFQYVNRIVGNGVPIYFIQKNEEAGTARDSDMEEHDSPDK